MKLSRIIRPHSKGCRMRDKQNEWSGLLKGYMNPYWGNHAANAFVETPKHHLWYVIGCNDPNCGGEKAVHSSVLANA